MCITPADKRRIAVNDVDAAGNLTGSVIHTLRYGANNYPFINENEVRTLSVFPNPATNQITLEVEEPISTLVITDVTGKTVFSSNKVTQKQVDVSTLKKGVYIITIQTDSYSATSKFIKE